MKNTKFNIEKIDNLILKVNFLIANYYFMIKNFNFKFYIRLIEKIKELNEKNKKDELLILEKSLSIINLNIVIKEDLEFLYTESKKFKEIFDDIYYDIDSYYYDLINKMKSRENTEKYSKLLNEINEYSKNIDFIIEKIEKIRCFNFEKICDEKILKNFLITIYDLKKSLDNFIV